MAKFSTVTLSIAVLASVVVVGIASNATAATLPTITSGTSTSTSSSSPATEPPLETSSAPATETATASPPATATASPTETAAAPDAITADIRVELGFPGDAGPMVFEVNGVVVDEGIELIGTDATSNPEGYCGDATVDISLNPTTITVTGGEDYCNFEQAYVVITMHGLEFASATVLSDNLFEPWDDQFSPGDDLALSLSGGSYKARGVHFAIDEGGVPTLQSYGVSGSTFTAFWSGDWDGNMSGASVFSFVPLALAADGAAADPTFTG